MEKKISIIFIIAVILLAGCKSSDQEQSSPVAARDGVFIHITQGYDDPHRVLMPLKMAAIMAEDKDVLVYMDIHAVDLLVDGSADLEFADFESAHTYIKQLLGQNVGIYACPTCLKIAGHDPSELIDGVKIAEKEKFFTFTSGRILNFDY